MSEDRQWRKAFQVGRLRYLAGGVAVAALLHLASCGGGGGGGGGNDPDNGSGGEVTTSGLLWHDFFGLDAVNGLQVSDLSGAKTVRVSGVETAVPTPDGQHFITYEYDLDDDFSTVAIYTRDGKRVDAATFDGYVRRVRPSPVQLGRMILTWSPTAGGVGSDQVELIAIDFNGRVTLASYPGVHAAADWLPDGRVLHLGADGRLRIGTPALPDTAVAQLSVSGRTPAGLWVDPAGQRIITRWNVLWEGGGVRSTDLWISAIDGSGLEQLTDTGLSSYGVWSPDGAFFAYDMDPANACTSTGCSGIPIGNCDLYVAPSTSRRVGAAAASFTVTGADGRRKVLGCDLRGWTR